ncbi:MAG TPA: ABC-F family ATP-binding cassette domain-containing protein [Tepidisphaeraceae bacterium]|jgi:ATP-binding cassette subfamily F protein 3
MALVQLSNIEKTLGSRTLFAQLDFTINTGERIGFIGENGAGKSTLFKILTRQITPDDGQIAINDSTKIGLLVQDPVFDSSNTVIDEAELAFGKLHDLAHQLRDLEHAMAEVHGDALTKVLEQYQDVQHEFDLAGGYVWHHKLEATLLGVGLNREMWERPVKVLSGGQRSRLALAKVLIAEPDVLLLDEPTNHLDLAAIEWLENYLLDFHGAAVIISHDRYLLDRLATRIVWLTQKQLNSYPGNYSNFTEQKELHELTQQRAYNEQRADIAKQEEYIRRFKAGQRARQAKGREKRLDRLKESEDLISDLEQQKQITLSLSTEQRAGDRVLQVRDLTKSFAPPETPAGLPLPWQALWSNLNFEVKRGERIGILGPNGSGKTTLLKILLGEIDADAGEIKWGANLALGYYDQRLGDLDPDKTVFDETWGNRPVKAQEVRNILGALLFRGDDIEKPIHLLSGGERARVRLAQLLLEKPNVLLLDEPTNHLDVASSQALEQMLVQFPGTILCVSHDRYFLDKTVERLLILQPPGMTDFEGNYSAWMAKQRSAAAARPEKSRERSKSSHAQKTAVAPKPQNRKPSSSLSRLTPAELESQIASTEVAVEDARTQLGDPTVFRDPKKARAAQADFEKLQDKLTDLEAEYFSRG